MTTARNGQPAWLRTICRLADANGWDSVSHRMLGATQLGCLFIRGPVEVEVRAHGERISHAVRTQPETPAEQPDTAKVDAVKTWLVAPRDTRPAPARFTRVRRGVWADVHMVTYDACVHCGGRVSNDGLTRDDHNTKRWVHLHDADWVNDVHQAVPAGGPVGRTDQPGPWIVLGSPLAPQEVRR